MLTPLQPLKAIKLYFFFINLKLCDFANLNLSSIISPIISIYQTLLSLLNLLMLAHTYVKS